MVRYYGADSPAYRPDGALDDDQNRRRGAFGPPSAVRAHHDRYVDAGVGTFVTRSPSLDQRGQPRAYAELLDLANVPVRPATTAGA